MGAGKPLGWKYLCLILQSPVKASSGPCSKGLGTDDGNDDTVPYQKVKGGWGSPRKNTRKRTSITISTDKTYQSGRDLQTALHSPPKSGGGGQTSVYGQRDSLLASGISLSGPPETKTSPEYKLH